MTKPNRSTIRLNRPLSRRQVKLRATLRGLFRSIRADRILVGVVLFVLVLVFRTIKQSLSMNSDGTLRRNGAHVVEKHVADLPVENLAPVIKSENLEGSLETNESFKSDASVHAQLRPLQREALFLSSIKDCRSYASENPKCYQYTPKDSTKQRIGLLCPPGRLSIWLERFAKQAVVGLDIEHTIEWESTSHSPSYGYGPAHGYTKIIRLVPSPFIVGVLDVIDNVTSGTVISSHSLLSIDDAASIFRQLVRWHCRISYISEHTSVLTLMLDEVEKDPVKAFGDLAAFVAGVVDTAGSKPASRGLDWQWSTESLRSTRAQAESMLETMHVRSLKAFDFALSDEVAISANSLHWPCGSFWSTGEEPHNPISTMIPMKLAYLLVPQCDSSRVTCWMEQDKCEFEGPGSCDIS